MHHTHTCRLFYLCMMYFPSSPYLFDAVMGRLVGCRIRHALPLSVCAITTHHDKAGCEESGGVCGESRGDGVDGGEGVRELGLDPHWNLIIR